jgi:hypothetical protein
MTLRSNARPERASYSSVGAHWYHVLDTPDRTSAEFLGARGFLTARLAANTSYISNESGVNRGFTHYEDYVLSPRPVMASSAMGRWIADYALRQADFYSRKWDMFKSSDVLRLNGTFVDWLSMHRGTNRPFFAFLNYMDAHGPLLIISPSAPAGRTISAPVSLRDLPATVVDVLGLAAGSPFPVGFLASGVGSG